MSIQLPTTGRVKKAKLEKTLDSGLKIWKVRVGVGDQFIDAELAGGETAPPEGTELSVEESNFGPKAKRIRKGGGGRGRGNSPEDRASIEQQVAAKCLTELAVHDKITPAERDALTKWLLGRVA